MIFRSLQIIMCFMLVRILVSKILLFTNLACDSLIMKSCEVHPFIGSYILYTQISCNENMFDTWINVLIDQVWTYEWTNVTQISHLPINLCVKYVINAQYQCAKCTNYEWMNFVQFPSLSHEMLGLWVH